ncbi:hypothetical protein EO238_26820, partial [Citrobacter sp. AAK_AS5]
LAGGAPTRLDTLPAVPTLAELGFAAANLSSVFGVFAPAGTPTPALQDPGPEQLRGLPGAGDIVTSQDAAFRAQVADRSFDLVICLDAS